MNQPFRIITSSLLVAGLVAGCTSGDPLADDRNGADDDTKIAQERYGAIAAEVTPQAGSAQSQVDIQAQFLDARGVPVQSALEALEVWVPHRGLETGDCRFTPVDDPVADHDYEPVSLHLLDVGGIDVQAPGETTSLAPRQLPDLLNSFHGVVYGNEWSRHEDDETIGYHPEDEYRIRADGSDQAGEFDVQLQAPPPVVLAAANGQRIDGRDAVTIDARRDLELVWETEGTEQGEVFIDLTVSTAPDTPRVQCRTGDNGAFSIPADKLAHFDDGTDLQIRRVHRTAAAVEGLDSVDFYFAATDRIELYFD